MHQPSAISTYRPRPSVAPRAARPLPEMCEHFAPRATCVTCRTPLTQAPPDTGWAAMLRRDAKRAEALRVLVELDTRRPLPPPPRVPAEAQRYAQGPTPPDESGRWRKNGFLRGVQCWKLRSGKQHRTEAERAAARSDAAKRGAVTRARRKAQART